MGEDMKHTFALKPVESEDARPAKRLSWWRRYLELVRQTSTPEEDTEIRCF